MIRHLIILCVFFCQIVNLHAQFFDDFSDSNLNENPVWEGDVQNFIVNSSQELQLNAADGGVSNIYTQLNFPDSIKWEFEFSLNFSPSDNNKLRIYIALDGLDIQSNSGYYLEIGENGANDALNFFYLNNGLPELLGTGSLASLGTEPAFAKMEIFYFPNGEWTFNVAYENNDPLLEELTLFHNLYDFSGNQFFNIECIYTSSRKDKFFFDNIGISKFELDKIGPEIIEVKTTSSTTIEIQCNEFLNEASISEFSNYNIIGYSGQVESAELLNNGTGIKLTLSTPLNSGTVYSMEIKGLQDVNLNESINATFEIFIIENVEQGDLVINEILFNPETNGSDYVEIYNISDKFLTIENLQIANTSRSEYKPLSSDLVIKPGKYLCLTEDINYLKERYQTPDTASFLFVDLPSFNNDDGNVSIVDENNNVIDAFDYSEDFHFQQLDDLNGVSLERINPFGNSQTKDNWFSASSSALFGTPGYRNSILLNPEFSNFEVMDFENKTFSPNQDGFDDQLIIKYKLPANGYLVDIEIYDQGGRLIKKLVNNELLSNTGFVLWDGTNAEGEISNIGIYFVVFEAFNETGSVLINKKPAILADFLD